MLPTRVREAVVARDQFQCVCCGRDVVLAFAEVHHRRLRSQGGGDGQFNLVTLSRECHAEWHGHPLLARRHGIIVPSWAHPVDVPVLHHALGWALPCVDGWVPAEPLAWQAA
jgi:hypothetical protein